MNRETDFFPHWITSNQAEMITYCLLNLTRVRITIGLQRYHARVGSRYAAKYIYLTSNRTFQQPQVVPRNISFKSSVDVQQCAL